MKGLLQAAAQLQVFFLDHDWPFSFIGGLAVLRWGEPRLTQDIDVSLLTGFGREHHFASILVQRYRTRISDAVEFAVKRRVLLLESDDGYGIDIAFAALPFEELVIRRSSVFEFLPQVALRTCSAEDLLVLKAFSNRPKDRQDLSGIVARQRSALDWAYIEAQLQPLLELQDDPSVLAELRRLREEWNS
jgi:hypothetical protein